MANESARTGEPVYEVVWPLGPLAQAHRALNPRPVDLNGKVVAELWDELFQGETLFPAIRDALRARFPGVRFVDYSEFGNPHGPRQKEVIEALPGLLREKGCDAVISGIGA